MEKKQTYRFDTEVIHQGLGDNSWEGATLPPIYQSASHRHESAEGLSDTFGGLTSEHIYMRLSNPTNRFLEEKLANLESGAGAVVMSSGMAAISNACMALLRAGDEFVASNSLFMSTYLLFTRVFKKYAIKAKLVDTKDLNAVVHAINDRTRFIYCETIGNPGMEIPDIEALAALAHKYGLPLIIDNTLASPWLFRPLEHGADIVLHSTTKFLSGHGAAPGGVVIDGGKFSWNSSRFPDFKPFVERKGNLAYLDKMWREHHINFGTTQAPFHSFLTALGLDTLALRMERHMENSLKVAGFLKSQKKISWVNYPGLENHSCHGLAMKQFQGKGFGSMLTFGLRDQASCFRFINSLKLILQLANLGDCKTLVIHPYSTQYRSFEEAERQELSIFPDMIRLSVGIEAWEDICDDINQALERL